MCVCLSVYMSVCLILFSLCLLGTLGLEGWKDSFLCVHMDTPEVCSLLAPEWPSVYSRTHNLNETNFIPCPYRAIPEAVTNRLIPEAHTVLKLLLQHSGLWRACLVAKTPSQYMVFIRRGRGCHSMKTGGDGSSHPTEGVSPESISQLSSPLCSLHLSAWQSHNMQTTKCVWDKEHELLWKPLIRRRQWSREWAKAEKNSFFWNLSRILDFRTQKGSYILILEVQLITLATNLIKNTVLGPTVKQLV